MPAQSEATPDDPAAVLLKEFEALQEDLSSLRRKHAELAQAGASQEQRLARAEEDVAFWRGAAERYHEQLGAKAAEVERCARAAREGAQATRDAAPSAPRRRSWARARRRARRRAAHAEKAALKRKNAELREKLGASGSGASASRRRARRRCRSSRRRSACSRAERPLQARRRGWRCAAGPRRRRRDPAAHHRRLRRRRARYSPW